MQAPLNTKIVAMVHEVEKNQRFFDIEAVKEAFNLSLKEA